MLWKDFFGTKGEKLAHGPRKSSPRLRFNQWFKQVWWFAPKKTSNQSTVGGIQIVNIIFEVHIKILIQSLSINPHADCTTELQHSQLK